MRILFAAVLFPFYTAFFATAAMISALFSHKRLPTAIMKTWARWILATSGLKVKVSGLENVSNEKPSIYMPNHASMVDIPILIHMLPVDLRFIFKKSITLVPLVGWAIVAMGMVPIDRGNRGKARESLRKAGERIRGGFHILVFPEGTRTRDGELLPFKKGGLVLALQESIDIVPVSLRGVRKLCSRNSIIPSAGTIEMVIHPRIQTQQFSYDDRNKLMTELRDTISSSL